MVLIQHSLYLSKLTNNLLITRIISPIVWMGYFQSLDGTVAFIGLIFCLETIRTFILTFYCSALLISSLELLSSAVAIAPLVR